MRKTYKYRIYITNGQRRLLEEQLEICRWVYNETLAERKRAWEERGESLSLYQTQGMLPVWKHAKPELKRVHSQVLQNISVRVDLAYQAFFRRVKQGDTHAGFPRFKGRGRYDSMTFPQYGNGADIRSDDLILSKIGRVKVVWHRPLQGTPKTVTVIRSQTGKWYVAFSCVVEPKPLPPTDRIVGVDVGLESFATLSNGTKISNPRFYRRDEADLKRVQRRKQLAKDAQDWPENAKQLKIVQKIHERIKNRRADHAHQLSRVLVDHFQLIAFEELAPGEMGKSSGMRKSIRDAAWSQLIGMTVSKAEEAGRTVILVDPRNTSKMCSRCAELVSKSLSERRHVCPNCGLDIDRDHNAAITILQRALLSLQE